MEAANVDNLRVLYQSTDFIVLDKHWDIRIDSKQWYETCTVQKQLKHKFPELADPSTYYGFRFCHQLDYSTSGALCVALNRNAAGKAYRCFKERLATKAYLALVRGHLSRISMTIDYGVGKNSTEGMTHMMCAEGTPGCTNVKPCKTELFVLQYGTYDGQPVTKVLLQPLTGRTHQLRVHCSVIGHPIVGDFTYSLKTDCSPYRMMLHAYFLRIPVEDEPIEVISCDPFVTSVDEKWVPQQTVQEVHIVFLKLKEQGLQRELSLQRVQDAACGKHKETGHEVIPETEEQSLLYTQWLANWSLD
ncbi:RNA pseudouridylate synthase domain-containing protein 1 [Erpetoichthys calabaricus]|uniref:RNA pseudouridylate synthase domain-containing protein 1 n=1 Tax=Erpetoichthys calabaricus TaxID=27687 RepID=UPI002234E7EC|nr:RNA pseudouridylate synthase domain-containing protein 1 [Erpetoichthys calabaricus]